MNYYGLVKKKKINYEFKLKLIITYHSKFILKMFWM